MTPRLGWLMLEESILNFWIVIFGGRPLRPVAKMEVEQGAFPTLLVGVGDSDCCFDLHWVGFVCWGLAF